MTWYWNICTMRRARFPSFWGFPDVPGAPKPPVLHTTFSGVSVPLSERNFYLPPTLDDDLFICNIYQASAGWEPGEGTGQHHQTYLPKLRTTKSPKQRLCYSWGKPSVVTQQLKALCFDSWQNWKMIYRRKYSVHTHLTLPLYYLAPGDLIHGWILFKNWEMTCVDENITSKYEKLTSSYYGGRGGVKMMVVVVQSKTFTLTGKIHHQQRIQYFVPPLQ